MGEHYGMKLDGPPDTSGWTWKQVVMGGFLAVALAIRSLKDTPSLPSEGPRSS